jgi:hypothetical protein
VQDEVDALDPNALRDLYRDDIGDLWDSDAYEEEAELPDAELTVDG